MGAEHVFDFPDVPQGDGLAAAGVVGNGQHAEGYLVRPVVGDEGLERGHVHVALERALVLGRQSFGAEQVRRLPPHILDIGAGGIEMTVVGHPISGAYQSFRQDRLGGPSLMGGQYVGKTGDIPYGALETFPGPAAGVAFVPHHHGRPLGRGHGAGAAVGEQVDTAVVGVQQKDVVMRPLEGRGTLLGSGQVDGLRGFDAKGLDDRTHIILLNTTSSSPCPLWLNS